MPDQTYQLPRDSTMQGIVTQLQNIASRMNNSGGSGGGSTVVANPSGTASDDLTSIEIDGTIYDIPSGSGSSYDDTALRALIAAKQDALTPGTGIQISNGTISCTVQGGSGSGSSSEESGYSRTELFKSSTPQQGVVSLSDAIDNYDDIEIIMGWLSASDTAGHTERFNAEYFVTNFPYVANPTNANSHALLEMWASNGFSCAVGDATNTALQTWGHNGSSGIMAVYGLKYGAGGASSVSEPSFEKTLIYEGTDTIGSLQSHITLEDSWDNYDVLEVLVFYAGESTYSDYVSPEALTKAQLMGNDRACALATYGISSCACWHLDANHKDMDIFGTNSNNIWKIYGIKFGSSSSSSQEEYSTTEKVIGKWIDGRDIYQITIGDETAPVSQQDLSSLNIDFTIDIDGIFGDSNLGLSQCTYTTTASSSMELSTGYVTYSKSTHMLNVVSNYGYVYCVTLKYVKSTD